MVRAVGAFLLLILVLCPAGCGRKGAKVTGALVDNGQPLKIAEKERVTLTFIALGSRDQADELKAHPGANVNTEDATFTFVGPHDGAVAPGEYRIALSIAPREGKDRFAGRFNAENSPLKYTVGPDSDQQIVIDVGAKTVSRK